MAGPNVCKPPASLLGYGAFLRRYDAVLSTWVTVAGLVDIPVPPVTRAKIESNDDDGDGTVHYVMSPQSDLSDVSYAGDYIEEQYNTLLNLFNQDPANNICWQVVLNTPQQRYYEWCGFIMSLSAIATKKGLVTASVTVATSGGGLRTGELVS